MFAGRGRRGWGRGAAAAAAGGCSVDGRLADGSGGGGGICQAPDVSRGAGDEPVRAEERGWG